RRDRRSRSRADRPVLYIELRHREVPGVSCRQSRSNAVGRGSDQAVGLAEGDPPACMVPAPASGTFALRSAERSQLKSAEEAHHRRFVLTVGSTQHLLDVDRAYPWHLSGGIAQAAHALGGRAAAQSVDQDGRVEEQRQRLANARRVTAALLRHPTGRIPIPLMLTICECAESGFDVLPTAFILERAAHRLAYERAAAS